MTPIGSNLDDGLILDSVSWDVQVDDINGIPIREVTLTLIFGLYSGSQPLWATLFEVNGDELTYKGSADVINLADSGLYMASWTFRVMASQQKTFKAVIIALNGQISDFTDTVTVGPFTVERDFVNAEALDSNGFPVTLRNTDGTVFLDSTEINTCQSQSNCQPGQDVLTHDSDNNKVKLDFPRAYVSDTAPTDPSLGTLWYDSSNEVLKLWNGTKWVEIGPSQAI